MQNKNPVEIWYDTYREQFERYNKYCTETDWTIDTTHYEAQKEITETVLGRLKYFITKFEAFLASKLAKDIIEHISVPLHLYTNRVNKYIADNDWTKIVAQDRKMSEMQFQTDILSDFNKITDKYIELGLEDVVTLIQIPIHSDKPIPLLMRETVKEVFPKIEEIESTMQTIQEVDVSPHTVIDAYRSSKEMFINMPKSDIPIYDGTKDYFAQPKSTLEFFEEEFKKIVKGITINGTFIHPWLYWHLNFFKTDLPAAVIDPYSTEKTIITNPPLRDNEWFISEMYKQAEESSRGLFIFGSRRIAKALRNNELLRYTDGSRGRIGDAKVGDEILDGNNKPTKITGVFPQGKRQLYRLQMTSTQRVDCDIDHLWKVQTPEGTFKVISTGQLLKEDYRKYKILIYGLNNYVGYQHIGSITKIDIDYATCISVDSPDKTFITTGGVVTHNTTMEASILSWIATKVRNSESLVIGGDAGDLQKLSRSLEIALTNVHPAFRLPRNNNDWTKHIQFGLKDKAGMRIPYGDIFIRNLNQGKENASERTAGATPDGWICDEAGKFNVKSMYQAAIPSFQTPRGWGVVPILTGCLTANNKVFTKSGELKYIKDLKVEDGILGFDGQGVIEEDVNWLKPPSLKRCVRINLEDGNYLECSYDHPIMVLDKDKAIIKTAEQITPYDSVLCIDEVPMFGKERYTYTRDIKDFDVDLLNELDEEHFTKYITNLMRSNGTIQCRDNSNLNTIQWNLLRNGKSSIIKNNILKETTYSSNDYKFQYNEELGKGSFYIGKTIRGVHPVEVKDVMGIGLQIVYNLNTSITNSYISNGIISMNTGGNAVLSLEAQEMLTNPKAHHLVSMDWDLMEENIDPDFVTWQRREFGVFMPAQMSYKTGLHKIQTNLGDYLGAPGKELKDIAIQRTDWVEAKKVIEADRALLTKEIESLNKEKMYYPLDPMESFLNRGDNPFCAVEAQEHYEDILRTGDAGKSVIVGWDGRRLTYKLTDKPMAEEFPFKGGVIDAPVLMLEDPPEDPKLDFTYVAGLDHYKQDTSNTSSLGALVIFKRQVNIDEWSNKVVCTYASRPDRIEIFNQVAEMLLKGYGAICLQENTDISFQQHLRERGIEHLYLASGEDVARTNINPRATQNNKLGLSTVKANQDYLHKITQNYINEFIEVGMDEEGNPIKKRGVTRIKDPLLLKEIINYRPGMNVDRIDAFGHALALARYYDSLNIIPKVNRRMEDEDDYRPRSRQSSVYGSGRRTFSPY